MRLKPLHELNREFQMEAMKNCGGKSPDYAESIENRKSAGNIVFTGQTRTDGGYLAEAFGKYELKQLGELNQEFEIFQTWGQAGGQGEAESVAEAKAKVREIYSGFEQPKYINIKYAEQWARESAGGKKAKKKRRGILAAISDIVFYLAIMTVLFAAVTSGAKEGAPKMVMGYSYFTVLTSSMENEIPKGSLIFVRHTDPQKLEKGDNITYMRDANTTVTHKIINVYENYENSGARGFRTKGVNNTDPDKDIVYAGNVVGKVILVFPGVGPAISYFQANIYIVFVIFGLCVAFSFLLRLLFVKPAEKAGQNQN